MKYQVTKRHETGLLKGMETTETTEVKYSEGETYTETITNDKITIVRVKELRKSFCNFETLFRSLKDLLVDFLDKNNFFYEISSCGSGWHFEISLDENERETVEAFLESESITDQRA